MTGAGRDRVSIDLRGVGDTVRAAARARQTTVAAFAREALLEAVGPLSERSMDVAGDLNRSEIVKFTLRLQSLDAPARAHAARVRREEGRQADRHGAQEIGRAHV